MTKLDYSTQANWQSIGGQQQSPINIETKNSTASQLSAISWRGLYQAKTIIGTATTLEATGTGMAYLNDRDFNFDQIHFHTPAEHLIDGQAAPIEWHLVHRSATGQLAVVAIFGRIGKPNASFQALLDQFTPATSHALTEPIDLTELLPDTGTVYHYHNVLAHPSEWLKLRLTTQYVGKEGGQLECSHIIDGSVEWHNCLGKWSGIFS